MTNIAFESGNGNRLERFFLSLKVEGTGNLFFLRRISGLQFFFRLRCWLIRFRSFSWLYHVTVTRMREKIQNVLTTLSHQQKCILVQVVEKSALRTVSVFFAGTTRENCVQSKNPQFLCKVRRAKRLLIVKHQVKTLNSYFLKRARLALLV